MSKPRSETWVRHKDEELEPGVIVRTTNELVVTPGRGDRVAVPKDLLEKIMAEAGYEKQAGEQS